MLYDLNGATVFSKIDLKWGFHQIELEEDSRDKTTFVTHRGLYRYRRLMFGITSAPEKYQKIVSDVLAGCSGVANIADDLIIYGTDLIEHDLNLRKVLERLREKGLTLNGDKCQFRMQSFTFFGHDLSAGGNAPSEEKVAALVNARPPQNVSEVRSFVQLAQFSAKFIPNFAQIADPLRQLLRKGQSFFWGSEQQKSYEKLKELMTSAKALHSHTSGMTVKQELLQMLGQGELELFYYNCMEISGGLCRMLRGICQRLSDVTHRRRRRHLLLYGLANGFIFMCMVASLSLKPTINHLSVFLVRHQNHLLGSRGGS